MNIEFEGLTYANATDLPTPPKSWKGKHLQKWFCGMAALKVIIENGGEIKKDRMKSCDGPLYRELEPLLTSKYKIDRKLTTGKSWENWFDLADWATTYRRKEGRLRKDRGVWKITEKGREYYIQYQDVYKSRFFLLLDDSKSQGGYWNLPKDAVLSSELQKNFDSQEIQQRNEKEKRISEEEVKHTLAIQGKEGGNREVPIYDAEVGCIGIADLVTPTQIIEVKKIENWKHAIGQVYTYWLAVKHLGLEPRIHLFGANGGEDFRIKQAKKVAETLPCVPPCVVSFDTKKGERRFPPFTPSPMESLT